MVTKIYLLGRLREAVSPVEWNSIISNQQLTISAFNRSVLLELKDAEIIDGQDMLEEKSICILFGH